MTVLWILGVWFLVSVPVGVVVGQRLRGMAEDSRRMREYLGELGPSLKVMA